MLGPYGTLNEPDSFWQFVWPAGEFWWCSSCPASHTGAAPGLAAGLLLSCGPTTFLVYWPASLYLPYSLDAARKRHKPSGPPTGAALSTLWATDRPRCYEPGINQTVRGGRNDLWPPPEKHSLRRVVSLIPPSATNYYIVMDMFRLCIDFFFKTSIDTRICINWSGKCDGYLLKELCLQCWILSARINSHSAVTQSYLVGSVYKWCLLIHHTLHLMIHEVYFKSMSGRDCLYLIVCS